MFSKQKESLSEGKGGMLRGHILSEIEASREHFKATGEGQIIQADITHLLTLQDHSGPWDFALYSDIPEEAKAFLWHDGRSNRSFYAVGVLDERTFNGTERFSLARKYLEKMKQRFIRLPSVLEDDGEPPLMIGGFGFSTDQSSGGVWRDWPNGWLVVPKVLAYTSGDDVRVVCNIYIDPTSPDSSTTEQLNEIMALLAKSQKSPKTNIKSGAPSHIEKPLEWKRRIEVAKEQISSGLLDKVVPARSVVMPIEAKSWDHNNSINTLISLKRQHPTAVTFGVINGKSGSFLGASPEFLVCARNGMITAEAVAGTRRRDIDSAKDEQLSEELLSSPKERAEHDMVVQFIKSQMSAVGVNTEGASSPSIRQLSHIQHLHTPLYGTIPSGTCLLQLVETLHPTPAVAGLPRSLALKHISETESMDRGWYSGPIGWIRSDGSGEFIVGLRSAIVRDGEIHAFAGAGVVEGSDFAAEWDETRLKLSAICDVISGGDTQKELPVFGEE